MLGVELFDLEKQARIGTFHRESSRCTFAEGIRHLNFELTLRLDWGDLNDEEPMLDLDVVRIEPDGQRFRLKLKENPVHHTSLSPLASGNTGPRTYDLLYEGLRLRLVAKKSFATTASMSAYIVKLGSNGPDEA